MLKTPLLGLTFLSLTVMPCEPNRSDFAALHDASEIEALVGEAADFLERHGHQAFGAFRVRDSRWRYGNVYLFVVDMHGSVLFNAEHPDREGRDLLEERDADGKQFHRAFIDVVEKFGSGWVDYMFPKPGQAAPTVKWSYVSETKVDDVPALVGAGVYVY